MKDSIWDVYKREKRINFSRVELEEWIGKVEVEKLEKWGILRNLPIDKYRSHHKEYCKNGQPKSIIQIAGVFYKVCGEDPESQYERLEKEERDRLRLDISNMLAVIRKKSGLKGRTVLLEDYIYRLGVYKTAGMDYSFIFYDFSAIEDWDIEATKAQYEPERACILLIPDQDIIYSWTEEKMKKRGIYLCAYEDYINWKSYHLELDAVLERYGISKRQDIELDEKLEAEIDKKGFKARSRIIILGDENRRRQFKIRVDGQDILLGLSELRILLRLAVALRDTENGFLDIQSLVDENYLTFGGRYQSMARLKMKMNPKGKIIIENERGKGYRISLPFDLIEFDFNRLKRISDSFINSCLSKLR